MSVDSTYLKQSALGRLRFQLLFKVKACSVDGYQSILRFFDVILTLILPYINDSCTRIGLAKTKRKMYSETRSYNPWIWLVLPIWCLAFLVLFPPHQLDIAVSRLFWIDGDWPWHHNVFFSEVLHKGAKAVPIIFALWVIYQLFRLKLQKSIEDRQEKIKRYAYVFVAMLTSVLLCWWLKQTTGVSCPWTTTVFGGSDLITDPGWSLVARAGNCWPGGHAGTGFCLFALFFALRDHHPAYARWCLLAVFVFGSICGFARTMQGAHFVSHNIATMLIDWIVCAVLYVLFFDREKIISRFLKDGPVTSHAQSVFAAALFWTIFLDVPFWRALIGTAGSDPELIAQTLFLSVVLALSFFFVALSVIELLAISPKRVFQLFMLILSISGVTALISALLYGTTMTPDMVRNFLQTDTKEASMYLSVSSVLLFAFLFIPAILILKNSKSTTVTLEDRFKRLGLSALFLLIGILLLLSQLQPFSAIMRMDKSMRYMIAPFNVVYSTASTLLRDKNTDAERVRHIVDPNPYATEKPQRATVFVLMIGETARSANWQLAGYGRETTPRLAAMDIINIPKVQACGTSTDVSLPCMLSRIGRRDYDRDRILSEEALPSLLQRSGFNVTWIDNQSGSKGTSDGVKTVKLSDDKTLCNGSDCMDMAFVLDLKKRLQTVKPGERQVLILHMMGSHGPAYDLRSEDQDKVFGKVCNDPSFRRCSPEEIVNAYDASIRYTDRVLAEVLRTLQSKKDIDTAFIYLSDHGESLGEGGLFLHGAPYKMAPDEQKIIPMVMWLSDGFKADYAVSQSAIEKAIQKPVTHDHLYHTVLGLLNIHSMTYESRWDLSNEEKN